MGDVCKWNTYHICSEGACSQFVSVDTIWEYTLQVLYKLFHLDYEKKNRLYFNNPGNKIQVINA